MTVQHDPEAMKKALENVRADIDLLLRLYKAVSTEATSLDCADLVLSLFKDLVGLIPKERLKHKEASEITFLSAVFYQSVKGVTIDTLIKEIPDAIEKYLRDKTNLGQYLATAK